MELHRHTASAHVELALERALEREAYQRLLADLRGDPIGQGNRGRLPDGAATGRPRG